MLLAVVKDEELVRHLLFALNYGARFLIDGGIRRGQSLHAVAAVTAATATEEEARGRDTDEHLSCKDSMSRGSARDSLNRSADLLSFVT
jgi:hypothetical protein